MPGGRPHAIQFVLQGKGNQTLEGTLILDDLPPRLAQDVTHVPTTEEPYDEQGASAYATVVIAVYGFSIVLLIASHIFLKKKQQRRDGDEQQIDKYLQQVPELKEESKRESFRRLKRSIIPLVSIGVGKDLTALAQTRHLSTSSFDDPECHSRRSSFENDPNRPLLEWIQRETARRALATVEGLPTMVLEDGGVRGPTSVDSETTCHTPTMPMIVEEGSDDSSISNNQIPSGSEDISDPADDTAEVISQHRKGMTTYTSALQKQCLNELWLTQNTELLSPDEYSPDARDDEVFLSPELSVSPYSDCPGNVSVISPCSPLPSPYIGCPDNSPRRSPYTSRQPNILSPPPHSPLLPRFLSSSPKSSPRPQSESETSFEDVNADNLLQVTCV